MTPKEDKWLDQFINEQRHIQKQTENNERVLNELFEEWVKYPNGKPSIIFEGYGKTFKQPEL